MDIEQLKSLLENEKSFREKQIINSIFNKLLENFDDISNIPKNLKKLLKDNINLEINGKIFASENLDSIKAVITLEDNKKIETVLMRHKNRNTICVSSQVGCAVGCKFCATGKMGFIRQLTYSEILLQVLFFARYLKKENQKINSIVFMGMGEPMFNYENVIKAIYILNDPNAFNIGARQISISTSGISEGIKKLAKENIQVNLAISIHSASDKNRSEIMPINDKIHLKTLMTEVFNYIKSTKRKVMIEYLMLKDINDSEKDAILLANMLKKYSPKAKFSKRESSYYFVNLISYNPTGKYAASSKEKIKNFIKTLKENDINVQQRFKFGRAINAACGQLATKN